jgi:uncharacterized protein YgbK (DUF1537 family)
MALDPLDPVTESFIPAIIAKQSAIPVGLVACNSKTPEPKNSREILVYDGEKAEDLLNTARLLWEDDLLRTSAGCAGFAEALTETLPLEKKENVANHIPMDNFPILFIAGSLHPVSINQVIAAQKNNIPCCCLIWEKILRPGWLESKEAEDLALSCSQALFQKGNAILGTEASLGMAGPVPKANGVNIPAALGAMAQKIIEKTGPLHLAVFGGDTLLGIAQALGYHCIMPLQEIRSGIVLAALQGQKGNGLLITKAGAFGDKDLIWTIVDFMAKGGVHVRI